MGISTHNLHQLAIAARIAAGLSILSFVAPVGLLYMTYLDPSRPFILQTTGQYLAACGVLASIYLLPGILLWFLAARLDDGAIWPFGAIVLLAVFDLLKVFFTGLFMPICCNVWVLRLPTLLLAAACLNAWSDVRDAYRQRRRARRPRGFEAIVTSNRPAVTPPPPARQMRVGPKAHGSGDYPPGKSR